jgi:hypothetical protein
LIAIPDRNSRAGYHQALDDRPADALRATGDHCIPAAKIDLVGHGGNLSEACITDECRIVRRALHNPH